MKWFDALKDLPPIGISFEGKIETRRGIEIAGCFYSDPSCFSNTKELPLLIEWRWHQND